MLRVKNTVLIMLSTNLGKDNHYSKMFDKAKGEYEPLFLKKQVDLMCEACKKAKKDPSECNHNEHRNPSWLSSSSKKKAKFFMTNQAMYAREVLGVVMSEENYCLDSSWIQRLSNKERWLIKYDPSFRIFTYIDPNGGGAKHQSETAICSVIRTPDGKSILIGAASWYTQNEKDTNDFIIAYFRNFRNHEIYSKMIHMLIVERNFGGTLISSWIVNRATHALPTLQQYHLPGDQRDGLTLHSRNKAEAVMDCITLLDEDRVCIAEKIISHDPRQSQSMIDMLLKQMGKLRKVFEGGRWTFTAKAPGEQDDLCVAFLMAQKYSADITIVARLNEEQRARLEEAEQQLGYDEVIHTDVPARSGFLGHSHVREDESWYPSY